MNIKHIKIFSQIDIRCQGFYNDKHLTSGFADGIKWVSYE